MDIRCLWIAEYSVDQGCTHVDELSISLKNNLEEIVGGLQNTYVPFFVGTEDGCHVACERLDKKIGKKQSW